MNLPEANDLSKILATLCGDDVDLTLTEKSDFPGERTWGSIIIDDDGEPIGAILADLDASVNFGGKMMMIPPSTFAEQIEENEAGEAVIEACSEVFNNLTSAINRVPGNKHVRSRPAELTKSLVGSEPWLSESKGGSYGGSDGCIYIYYRG